VPLIPPKAPSTKGPEKLTKPGNSRWNPGVITSYLNSKRKIKETWILPYNLHIPLVCTVSAKAGNKEFTLDGSIRDGEKTSELGLKKSTRKFNYFLMII